MTRRLNFHSANAAAFNSKEPEVVLSGPAGTGKTATWLAKMLAVGDKYPGARMLIVRKTRESLTESVLVTWERDILGVDHPLLTKRPVLRRVRQSYDLGNGSVVAVGGMDKPDKVLSSEWDIIYCFTGDTRVESPSRVEKAFHREYSGPLVTIRTALGNELTGSPNHPILTDHGWVALGQLQEGGHVVSRTLIEKPPSVDPNVHYDPPTLAEVAGAIAVSPTACATSQRVSGTDMDFHGDGCRGNVDVVTAGREFGFRRDSATGEHVGEQSVWRAQLGLLGMEGLCPADQVLFRLRFPSYRCMADFQQGGHVARVASGSEALTVADGSQRDATPPQLGLQGRITNPDRLGDADGGAFPFDVAFDRIVHVRRFHTDASDVRHLYNLQTEHGYYVANGIVAHNCPEATDLQLVDWETLGGRLRSGVVPWQQLCGDCNPTTPTHWLYQRSESGGLKMYTSTHQDNPRFYDRKKGQWTPDGEQYISRLKLMTGARRKRFLEGIWAAAEGLVYDGFDPAIHVHPAGWTAPKDWRRVWGIDWGFVQPLCVQVWAIDGEKRLHLCRELYRTRTRVEAVAKECAAWVESGDEPHPEVILADHDPECIETFRKYGRYKQKDGRERELPVKPADKRDRDKGIQLVQGLFDKQGDGKPAIHFAQNTLTHRPDDELRSGGKPTDTRGELVGYVWKVPKPEQAKDEPIEFNDHAMDCMRYVAVHVRRSRVLMS